MNHRQGDIELIQIAKLPKNLKLKFKGNKYVLAYGEVTGHKHELRAECEILEDEVGLSYLVVTKEGKIVHGFDNVVEEKHIGADRHDTQTIKTGIYKLGNEREFDYFKEIIKRSRD